MAKEKPPAKMARLNGTIHPDLKKKAEIESEKMYGYVNVSAYISFLIKNDKPRK